MNNQIDKYTKEELVELLESCFAQACYDNDGKYNHFCISAYENAQCVLIDLGVIKKEKCRYKI